MSLSAVNKADVRLHSSLVEAVIRYRASLVALRGEKLFPSKKVQAAELFGLTIPHLFVEYTVIREVALFESSLAREIGRE